MHRCPHTLKMAEMVVMEEIAYKEMGEMVAMEGIVTLDMEEMEGTVEIANMVREDMAEMEEMDQKGVEEAVVAEEGRLVMVMMVKTVNENKGVKINGIIKNLFYINSRNIHFIFY